MRVKKYLQRIYRSLNIHLGILRASAAFYMDYRNWAEATQNIGAKRGEPKIEPFLKKTSQSGEMYLLFKREMPRFYVSF